jgi:imidazolonepropionase-like amidohydrolase
MQQLRLGYLIWSHPICGDLHVTSWGGSARGALQAATIEAARALGVEKESGSLEPGKRGDVLLLDADPLADIHNTRKVWRTVAAGAVYDPAPLWRSVGFTP